ncbi:hypothetical protein [Rhodohalobacter sp. 614A]|uniref:hypothetical protein n=1 Tax=Rhodohalobacter sp. 614A TaxID=2908649 RepID=UPI001F3535D5|nr:hypothetical protein [Rhodohalobacter sp. 614A]
MTNNQTVWLISFVILLVCILITVILYIYMGQIFIAIILAPPIIHWILKRRNRNS